MGLFATYDIITLYKVMDIQNAIRNYRWPQETKVGTFFHLSLNQNNISLLYIIYYNRKFDIVNLWTIIPLHVAALKQMRNCQDIAENSIHISIKFCKLLKCFKFSNSQIKGLDHIIIHHTFVHNDLILQTLWKPQISFYLNI